MADPREIPKIHNILKRSWRDQVETSFDTKYIYDVNFERKYSGYFLTPFISLYINYIRNGDTYTLNYTRVSIQICKFATKIRNKI